MPYASIRKTAFLPDFDVRRQITNQTKIPKSNPGTFFLTWQKHSLMFLKFIQHAPPSFPHAPWAWIDRACPPTSKRAVNCSLACRLPSRPVNRYHSKLCPRFREQLTMPCMPMPCIPINPASCWVMLPPMPPSMLKGLPPFSRAGDRWYVIIVICQNGHKERKLEAAYPASTP